MGNVSRANTEMLSTYKKGKAPDAPTFTVLTKAEDGPLDDYRYLDESGVAEDMQEIITRMKSTNNYYDVFDNQVGQATVANALDGVATPILEKEIMEVNLLHDLITHDVSGDVSGLTTPQLRN